MRNWKKKTNANEMWNLLYLPKTLIKFISGMKIKEGIRFRANYRIIKYVHRTNFANTICQVTELLHLLQKRHRRFKTIEFVPLSGWFC